jgi:hypothetical protein
MPMGLLSTATFSHEVFIRSFPSLLNGLYSTLT